MILQSAGLQTHQWNNTIKALMFLLLYPLIITTTYMAVAGALLLFAGYETARHGQDFHYASAFLAVWGYWFIPYLFIFGLILLVYCHDLNCLDLPEGEHFFVRRKNPEIYSILENLCISRGLSVPVFLIRDHDSCNAYSWGLTSDTYKIVVTSGLLKKLKPDELEAVLAHELTHILTGSTRLLFLTGTLSNIFRTLGNLFWPDSDRIRDFTASSESSYNSSVKAYGAEFTLWQLLFGSVWKLANLGALFAACFISRQRIYVADAGAVELTKNPDALLRALNKAGGNMWGFYYERAIKYMLFHYRNGRETAQHPSIEERIKAIKRDNNI